MTADDRCAERTGAGYAYAGHRVSLDRKVAGAEDQSGAAIPYHDNHKKTCRYSIKLKNVLAFIEDFENNPEKYAMPCSEFSAAKYKKPVIEPERLQSKLSVDFKKKLEKEWADLPDMLWVNEVVELTGYNKNTVNHWLDKGKLKSVVVQSGRVTSKTWLIEFYCGAGNEIVLKSREHLRLIEKLME